MADLRQTRKNIKTALFILVGVDVLAAVAFFSPLVGSAESRLLEMHTLQAELTAKTRQVEPLKDLPDKVKLANRQVADFYKKRFPAQYSQILSELGKLKAAQGVNITQAQYKPQDLGPGGLQPVEIEADLSGNYVSLARFINDLERDDMFFIINSVAFTGEQTGPVKLQMKLETYLKAGAQ
jgi:type IV pilus assembly protein PilO